MMSALGESVFQSGKDRRRFYGYRIGETVTLLAREKAFLVCEQPGVQGQKTYL